MKRIETVAIDRDGVRVVINKVDFISGVMDLWVESVETEVLPSVTELVETEVSPSITESASQDDVEEPQSLVPDFVAEKKSKPKAKKK